LIGIPSIGGKSNLEFGEYKEKFMIAPNGAKSLK
jgi:hypothetical protein